MLNDSKVTANVPAADLDRARQFYADKLGLTPVQEGDGGLVYATAGGTSFFLYQTEFAGQAGHTIAQWHVADIDSEVRELKDKGVTFEHYDMPGVSWDGDIATVPEMGRAAWFKDSEDNIMCIDDVAVG
jgi:predicted enzyme related to lactoylglutathione lyase